MVPDDQAAVTVIEGLAASLAAAARHNPNDTDAPAAVLWSDPNATWQPVIPHLRRLMPQLLLLGEFDPERRTGLQSGFVGDRDAVRGWSPL